MCETWEGQVKGGAYFKIFFCLRGRFPYIPVPHQDHYGSGRIRTLPQKSTNELEPDLDKHLGWLVAVPLADLLGAQPLDLKNKIFYSLPNQYRYLFIFIGLFKGTV